MRTAKVFVRISFAVFCGRYQEALDMYTLSLDNWMLIYKCNVLGFDRESF